MRSVSPSLVLCFCMCPVEHPLTEFYKQTQKVTYKHTCLIYRQSHISYSGIHKKSSSKLMSFVFFERCVCQRRRSKYAMDDIDGEAGETLISKRSMCNKCFKSYSPSRTVEMAFRWMRVSWMVSQSIYPRQAARQDSLQFSGV